MPVSLHDIIKRSNNEENEFTIENIPQLVTPSPLEEIMKKDDLIYATTTVKQWQQTLKIPQEEWDCLLLNYTEYKTKYPNTPLTDRQHDNKKQRYKRILKEYIKKEKENE